MLNGEELETCLKLGNAVAALKCRALGARAALPTADELTEFVARAGIASGFAGTDLS